MATILRSSKYFRFFANIGRNLVFNWGRGEIQQTVIPQKQCFNCDLPKLFVTQAVASHTSNDSNLERNLKRLDQNVRRTGRISKRELEDILDELRHSGSATSTQSLHIIRCCGNLIPEESPEIRTHLVEEIWKTLDNIGVPMDISHYNALLRVYLENEHSFSPTEFLANLESKGLEPNRVTYQRLIARYCQQGDIEGATRILEFMREKEMPVNENVFNALIMGHSQADDMESAVGIVGVMQQAGLEPSAETYTALLCGYAKKGDIESINSTLQECENKDIDLLDRDYMNIIFALAINNNLEHVDRIIERMRMGTGYNQDAVNLILRLINIGHEDLAYKIFLTMPPPIQGEKEQSPLGGFFIHQLVRANRPLEKIKALCERLEKEELNPRALLIATEISLQLGNIEQAYGLLQAMSDRNLPIRQHYFWPLLARHNKEIDRVLDILSQMCSQFKLNIGGETLRDYVIPSLEGKSSDEIITLLKNSGVSVAAAASAMVNYHLNQNNIGLAANVAMRYNAHYVPSLLRKPLVQAYIRTEDKDSFISILRQIHDGMDRTLPIDDDVPASIPDSAEIVGQFVVDVVAASQKNKITRIEAILQGLLDQGLGLSNSAAERLQEKLGEELSDTVSNLLGRLTSGELVPIKLSKPAASPPVKVDETQLLRLKKTLEEKGQSTLAVKKQMLLLYCRNKDLEKAEQLLKELEENNFVFTGMMYAHVLDMYLHFENLDEVLKVLNKLQEREPDFLLDNAKIIRVATLLVKNDRVPDAVQFLAEHAKERPLEDRSFQFGSLCFRLLNSLAEKGSVNELKEIFAILVKHHYIDVNNVLLGPLIKVHLVRDDLAGALQQFEWCCQNYRATPWKSELARKFIQTEDPTSLQKLTDLSIQIHGEVNSLYDLVFAFVECGRIRQAHKILETPGLRSRPNRLNSACERYQQEGLVEPLEGLVEATRDIIHIDRLDIYYHLLLSYCKSGDPDKALGLWTRMQEESVQPSDEFLSTLGKFLIENGQDVPFVMPELESPPVSNVTENVQDSQEKETLTTSRKLRQALRTNNVDTGLKIRQKAVDDGEDLSVTDLSLLIESLVKADRYGEASKLVQEILAKGVLPLPRVIRFFLNRIASAGDIDTLTVIGNQLSNELKKVVSYDNRLCHAHVTAGKAAEYMKKLSDDIENADESHLEIVSDKFPRGGALGILKNHPELHSEYEKMALKYAAKGIIGPINVLWMHHFVSGKDDAAEVLWNKYLVGSPRIMFQRILQEAREKKDEVIPRRLIKFLKDTAVSEGARGNSYSCLIDVLVHKEKYDEAETALKEAVEDVCLENLNRTALVRLKKGLEQRGKTFPYEIPAKVAKGSSSSSSSSSSSDDEPTRSKMQ